MNLMYYGLILDGIKVPSHSVITRHDNTAFYLNSTTGEVINFNLKDENVISSTVVSQKFIRGCVEISKEKLIIGSQNSLLEFDINALKVNNTFNVSENENETIFAIHELPDDFSLPPVSFSDSIGKIIGFRGTSPVFEKRSNSIYDK